ncbi:hypothetical protein BGW38_007099 [Lunasporangiospora selenospora]|uniref:Uncharacterized protein n=1 Tax=Lunasporangiospora selenospora TaxID=979761 RepID=A0A9P6FMY2_9FUNG|nr:hypothetical protein BGW38_007099 [Lunasporangiospora selenospora]
MPRSLFFNHEFFMGVVAVFGATIAFGRWVPDTDLIAADAHPSTYIDTLKTASESARQLYAVSPVVDIVRVSMLAILESTAFSFAFSADIFELFSWAPLFFTLITSFTKDVLLLGLLYTFPEINEIASAKVAELAPISVLMEQGLLAVGFICLAKGLYQWTYAIGRDKRQVIDKAEKEN